MIKALTAFFQTIALALGWAKREEEKKDDFQVAKAADLTEVVKEEQGAQAITESVHGLSDDELNRRLRASQSGGQ